MRENHEWTQRDTKAEQVDFHSYEFVRIRGLQGLEG